MTRIFYVYFIALVKNQQQQQPWVGNRGHWEICPHICTYKFLPPGFLHVNTCQCWCDSCDPVFVLLVFLVMIKLSLQRIWSRAKSLLLPSSSARKQIRQPGRTLYGTVALGQQTNPTQIGLHRHATPRHSANHAPTLFIPSGLLITHIAANICLKLDKCMHNDS